jgi:hypothetical protein
MRRTFTVMTLVMALIVSTMSLAFADIVLADGDFEDEYLAAPAVAGLLLEEAGIDNRYGSGRDGGNYIRDVADAMGDTTDFRGISKTDVAAYQCAVADFLIGLSAEGVYSGTGVVDPAASGATYVNNEDGTGTLVVAVLDECGNGIEGLTPSQFSVLSSSGSSFDFTHPRFAVIEDGDGVYTVTYSPNVFIPWRSWQLSADGVVIEPALIVDVTLQLVGDWKLDLYTGATLNARFIIIDTHEDGELAGFFGVGYDPEGNPTGTITGTVTATEGENFHRITMHYERTDIVTDYQMWLSGTIAFNSDGSSMSGTWYDNNTYTTPQNWSMTRQ